MLSITIKPKELFDERTGEFITFKGQTLQLEHSLVSLSKWESKWHKPFLDAIEKGKLSPEETIDYVKCMTLSSNIDSETYNFLDGNNMKEISEYISNSMTATTFNDSSNKSGSKEIVTSEIIYYSMVALQIPFECQKWHLNRLLTLIKVCNIKNQPPKKMSTKDVMSRNAALNAARRKQFNSKG